MGRGRRWIYNADERAIELHLRLQELEQMPLIRVSVSDDRKGFILADANNLLKFVPMSVNNILSLDIPAAKAQGGSFRSLFDTYVPGKSKRRIPEEVVAEGAHEFLTGDQD